MYLTYCLDNWVLVWIKTRSPDADGEMMTDFWNATRFCSLDWVESNKPTLPAFPPLVGLKFAVKNSTNALVSKRDASRGALTLTTKVVYCF